MASQDSWRSYTFPVTTGLTDGILTALTFGAAKVFASHEHVTASITFRLAAAAALSAAFVFFVADYARLRLELVQAERHLSLTTRGQLATTHLGRAVFYQSLRGMAASGVSSFCGALFPLLCAVLLPRLPWIAIIASIGALAFLGACLGRSLYGSAIRWAFGLTVLGGVLAWVGLKLHVV
jgi:predicted membrane protein (TIGR00267 family)